MTDWRKQRGGGGQEPSRPRLRGSSPTSTRELTNSGTASGGGGMVGKNNNTDTEDNTGSSLRGLDVHSLGAGGGGPSPSSDLPDSHLLRSCYPLLTHPTNQLISGKPRRGTRRGRQQRHRSDLQGLGTPPPGSCDSQHS